jgi:hypothetical protein
MNRNSIASFGAALAIAFTAFTSIPRLMAQSQVSWVTVRDNREQAFSVEVPKGWKTWGGLFRFSLIEARPFVDMTSPDGRINVRLGDASIPIYSTPKGGFAQVRATRSRQSSSVTGEQFAVKYGQARFSHMCQGLKLARSEAKPPKYTSAGQGPLRGTGGEAVFSCTVNGQATTGYVYAETFITGYGQPLANWSLVALGSVLAPTDQAVPAVQLLVHSGASMAMNPAWSEMQNRFNKMATQMNMANAMATIRETARTNAYEQRVIANMGHEQENFNDIINGVSLKRDPTSGQTYEVPLGTGGAQWIDPSRNVTAESAFSPGPGFNQMQTISR